MNMEYIKLTNFVFFVCVQNLLTAPSTVPQQHCSPLCYSLSLPVSLSLLELSHEESVRPITAGLCWIHTASQLHKTPGINPPLYSSKDDDEEGRRPTTSPNYCASI